MAKVVWSAASLRKRALQVRIVLSVMMTFMLIILYIECWWFKVLCLGLRRGSLR